MAKKNEINPVEARVKIILRDNPFLLGVLMSYLCCHSSEDLARLVRETFTENYRVPREKGGWGE